MRKYVAWAWVASALGVGALALAEGPAGKESGRATAWRKAYDAWKYPDPVPDFELVNQEGKAFQLASLADRYVLVGFVFSRCPMPNACPLTMTRFGQVQAAWKQAVSSGKTGNKRLALLGVTLDPAFDEPKVLKAFAQRYGADFTLWSMATGPHELVHSALPSMFAVMATPDGHGTVNHNVKVALLAPGLRILAEWPDNEFSASDVLARITGP